MNEERTIYAIGDVNSDMSRDVIVNLRGFDRDTGSILIVLNSNGGDLTDMWAIYDQIRMTKNKVIVYATGAAYSSAVGILQAGDVRLLSPNTRVMVHEPVVDLGGDHSLKETLAAAHDMSVHKDRYIDAIALRTKRRKALVKEWVEQETYFDANEAVKNGLADSVVSFGRKFDIPR